MKNMNLSDVEIEKLLFGKWRFNKDWEIIYVELKKDMTYEQTRIQTFILSKPMELLTGNKFKGTWYVNERRLCFNVDKVPKSSFNLRLPWLTKFNIADTVVNLGSIFIIENYKVVKINSSKFWIMDKDESFVGTKIT
jgi:hypothetical protein